MNNIIYGIMEELKVITSGKFIPYHKMSIIVACVVAIICSLVFSHSAVFNGKIAVIDLDSSSYSRELIDNINTSPYIQISEVVRTPISPDILMAHDNNIGVLFIPKGVEKDVKGHTNTVSIGYFGDYSNEAQNARISQALSSYIPELGSKISIERLSGSLPPSEALLSPMKLNSRNLFNPTSSMTNTMTISFIYFFSSIFYGLTVLMIIGRLKVTGEWENVLKHGVLSLLARIIPYAFLYTTGISIISALLSIFGQLRFEGNYFIFLPSIFMTCLAIGWIGFILTWKTNNPGEGASKMVFLVPPGFIFGGATVATGFLPIWAYYLSYLFPLVWQFRFYRDFALRGVEWSDMLSTYGAYLIYIIISATIVTVLFYKKIYSLSKEKSNLSTLINK
ncbi:ABC transporter permease [Providencia manganoxydans]|uniref:ABC transporter permease n=1 Tax=Providencia manganoxydans TaxID=2923283 RepID=UPI0034E5A3DA